MAGVDRIHRIDRTARIDWIDTRIDRHATMGLAVSCAWLRLFSSWPHSLNRCWACQNLTPEAFLCLA